ncbi:MAG: hypothetical protein KBH08_07615, partial [Brachymonas sp.]|nr:hypothetical protein [Brachymonas sp.]
GLKRRSWPSSKRTSMVNPYKLTTEYANQLGPQAFQRLATLCLRHFGGGTIHIADFLISLYNARFARPDLYMLCRRLDDNEFEDVMVVMRWFRDAAGRIDIHSIYGDAGDSLMHDLMDYYGKLPQGHVP